MYGSYDIALFGPRAFLKLGRDDDAYELCRLTVASDATNRKTTLISCHSVLGQVAAKRGDLDEAEGHFAECVALFEGGGEPDNATFVQAQVNLEEIFGTNVGNVRIGLTPSTGNHYYDEPRVKSLRFRRAKMSAAHTKVARELGLGQRINTVMQAVFYHLSGVLPAEEAVKLLKALSILSRA